MAYIQKNTDFLDYDRQMQKFSPLLKSLFTKFSKWQGIFKTPADYDDLRAQIDYEFMRLCVEYDPTRGVDFPGFIHFHLQQRVYHYVTKLQRHIAHETTSYGKSFEDESLIDFSNNSEIIDHDAVQGFDRAEMMEGLDWRALQGPHSDKYKRIVEYILYEGRTPEEIAKLEDIPVRVVRLRINTICYKLRRWNQLQNDFEEFYKPLFKYSTFEEYLTSLRKYRIPIKDMRVPVTQADITGEQEATE